MFKNVLAVVGLYVVGKFAYDQFQQHMRKPLERFITDTIDDETARAAPKV